MSDNPWTPGPWEAIHKQSGSLVSYVNSGIANTWGEHRQVNADLIALAPEMASAILACGHADEFPLNSPCKCELCNIQRKLQKMRTP